MRDNASEIPDYISHYIKSSAFLQKGVNPAKNTLLAQNPVTLNFTNTLCHIALHRKQLFPTKNAESKREFSIYKVYNRLISLSPAKRPLYPVLALLKRHEIFSLMLRRSLFSMLVVYVLFI